MGARQEVGGREVIGREVDLLCADLFCADLFCADLFCADLFFADLVSYTQRLVPDGDQSLQYIDQENSVMKTTFNSGATDFS